MNTHATTHPVLVALTTTVVGARGGITWGEEDTFYEEEEILDDDADDIVDTGTVQEGEEKAATQGGYTGDDHVPLPLSLPTPPALACPLPRLGDQRDMTQEWLGDAIGRFISMRPSDPQKTFAWFVETVKKAADDTVVPEACLRVDGIDQRHHIYAYQAFALRFALYREANAYYAIRGGILNMFPGLGKTLTLLTLVWTTWCNERVNRRPTLVVVPTSVVYEWRSNVHKFFGDRLPFFIMDRNWNTSAKAVDSVTVPDLLRYPLVITTYPVLRSVFSRKGFVDECVLRSDDGKAMGLRRATSSATSDVKGQACLYRVPWARVAFDESQTACNIARVTFQACYAVPGRLRWCLTGMPLRNSTMDMFGQLLISGLQTAVRPSIGRVGTFYAVHKGLWKPTTFRDARLNTTMLTVVYKDTHLRMPPLRTVLHPVLMQPEERRLYELFADMARKEFRRFEQGAVSLVNVLTRVTRMRQASNCAFLLHLSDLKKRPRPAHTPALITPAPTTSLLPASPLGAPLGGASSSFPTTVFPLHPEQKQQHQQQEQDLIAVPVARNCTDINNDDEDGDDDDDEDILTFDEIMNGHDEDREDAPEASSRSSSFSPVPSASNKDSVLGASSGTRAGGGSHVLDPVRAGLGEEMLQWCGTWESTAGRHASKVRAILDLVRRILAGEEEGEHEAYTVEEEEEEEVGRGGGGGGEGGGSGGGGARQSEQKPTKVIIYSAFAEMLRVLARAYTQEQQQHSHCIITGDNSADERTAMLDQFRLSSTHNVLFMTYKVGALGLTLTEATHEIFTEPWFCYSVHLQALYRVYRIGQTRPVHVHWMISHTDADADGAAEDDNTDENTSAAEVSMIEWRVLEIASAKIQMTNELLAQDLVADVPQHILAYMDQTDETDVAGSNKRKKSGGRRPGSGTLGGGSNSTGKGASRSGPTHSVSKGDTVAALRSFLFPHTTNTSRTVRASSTSSSTLTTTPATNSTRVSTATTPPPPPPPSSSAGNSRHGVSSKKRFKTSVVISTGASMGTH